MTLPGRQKIFDLILKKFGIIMISNFWRPVVEVIMQPNYIESMVRNGHS